MKVITHTILLTAALLTIGTTTAENTLSRLEVSRRLAVIFENEDVAKAFVVFQVQHAVAVGPQDVFHGAFGKTRESGHVVGSFDDDFVGTDAVHLVKEAFAFAVKIAFDTKSWKFVGDYANAPAGSIFAAAIAAIDQNFRGSFCFASRAEGTILGIRGDDAFTQKFVGSLAAFRRNNHPATGDGILPQLRQRCLLD